MPDVELHDLSAAETKNLQDEQPDVVARLTKLLEKQIAEGRSTPGSKQVNDAPVDIRKRDSDKPRSRAKQ